jgi:hypothetical protein
MVESANQGQFDDFALVGRFHGTRLRAILFQRPVRTVTMIIAQVSARRRISYPSE